MCGSSQQETSITSMVLRLHRGNFNEATHTGLNDSSNTPNVSLIDLRETCFSHRFRGNDSSLRTSIYQSICFGESGCCQRGCLLAAQNGRAYCDFQARSVKLETARITNWRVMGRHN